MTGVRMLHFCKRLMKIHSNTPILYYGINSLVNGHLLGSKKNEKKNERKAERGDKTEEK